MRLYTCAANAADTIGAQVVDDGLGVRTVRVDLRGCDRKSLWVFLTAEDAAALGADLILAADAAARPTAEKAKP